MKQLLGLLLALLLIASPLVLTLPWKDWMIYGNLLRSTSELLGIWSPLAFMGLTALGTTLGLPRLIFCIIAGWLFGFEWGFLWSQIGSLIGAYGLFLVARLTRPETLLERFPKLKSLSAPIGSGWFSVLIVRQLPLAGLYNDILLGWSPVSHRDFWIGSFIGFLPLGLTASLVGAGTVAMDLGQTATTLAIATILFLILSLGLKWLVQRRSRRLDSNLTLDQNQRS
ncbi:MAG: TVP38/TMEM64 family protein [Gammaproteobacteria bacterium]|nr:TVP38/TMEM64 family protein [Gammaproteobacteria bacterium]NBT44287.1 TVP38/TMEM64 family protein [Gammaproteobacteria bacterium]NBY21754.1 TVP38/TMEM64 family protein [Gammaproteobacteria bacterium]NDE56519.1 TVP38/TMEM64 family protein [Gammaproteobacteria bacterium]NDG87626.1 TVP38/TMEM64 family protein [Gammaproteobacteria bacterium]